MEILIQTSGWVGMFLIVFAYFLEEENKLNSDSKTYQLMNLFGSIGVGINVFYQSAWPAFALQIIWGLISLSVLIKILNKK